MPAVYEIVDGSMLLHLPVIIQRCQALAARVEHGSPGPAADLGVLSSLSGETIDGARAVAQGLYPLEPADGGGTRNVLGAKFPAYPPGTLSRAFLCRGAG